MNQEYCYQCGYLKGIFSFHRFNFTIERYAGYEHNKICNHCAKINEYSFKRVEKILAGISIPYYETPVTKYKIQQI